MPPTTFAPRPAIALIALARAMMLDEAVNEAEVAQLIEAICASRGERMTLLNALAQANALDLSRCVAGLFADYVAATRETETGLSDLDGVAGAWGMRISAGALLLGAASAVAGTLSAGAALLAVAAASAGGIAVAGGRLALRRRVNALARRREVAERLVLDLSETAPPADRPG